MQSFEKGLRTGFERGKQGDKPLGRVRTGCKAITLQRGYCAWVEGGDGARCGAIRRFKENSPLGGFF